jgi:acetone carboxylase gamma subunit
MNENSENNGTNETNWRLIANTVIAIRDVEEKFRKIQENPALHGAELGLTAQEHEMLEKVIKYCGEVAIAGDAIVRRHIGDIESASRFFQAIKPDPNDRQVE